MHQMTMEEAGRILASVPYDKRLTVGRMFMPRGIQREYLCSMWEAHYFLAPCSNSLPAIDFGRLADWIETTMQDARTAERVRNISETSSCYVDACKATYGLLGERIEEARLVLNGSAQRQGGSDVS